jgi:hypothetical protein
MARLAAVLLMLAWSGTSQKPEEVRHFPSIVFGQILLGPGASRYETIFTVTCRKQAAVTMDLFTDAGEPMPASFVDADGSVAATDSTMRFILMAGQSLRIKVQLPPDQLKEDVALRTGWANFRSNEDLDVWALVRILKPDGTLFDKHVLLSEKLTVGAVYDRATILNSGRS